MVIYLGGSAMRILGLSFWVVYLAEGDGDGVSKGTHSNILVKSQKNSR